MKCRNLLSCVMLILAQTCVGQLACSIHAFTYDGDSIPYVETYLGVQSKTLTYVNGKAQLQYILTIEKDGTLVTGDKYVLTIEETNKATDLWDVKRYGLGIGEYKLEILAVDTNGEDTLSYTSTLNIEASAKAKLSKPVLCSALGQDTNLPFEKYGIYYEKLAYDILPEPQSTLSFFQEVYNSDSFKEDTYLVRFSVIDQFYNPSMSGNAILTGYVKKATARKDIVYKTININHLTSGNYHLLTELIDKEQHVFSVSYNNFQINRPTHDLEALVTNDKEFETSFVNLLSDEELLYSLKALAPRLDGQRTEVLNALIKDDGNRQTKKYFLYSYWSKYSPNYAQESYLKYMEIAKAVDQMYNSNVGYGFETDRGNLFLRYGRPDIVIAEDQEPSAPPYEIWVYNWIESIPQSNVRFLFYNPSLAANDFQLLHSTSKVDIRNPQWQRVLYSDSPNEVSGNAINGTDIGRNVGRNAVLYFNE